MAEGDTILRAARRVGAALDGQAVEVSAPNRRGRAAGVTRLNGRTLEHVAAHGKHLLLHFGDLVLHSHLGMSGSWHVYRRGASWRKAPGAAWAVLRGKGSEAVQFGGRPCASSGPVPCGAIPYSPASAPTSSLRSSIPTRSRARCAPSPPAP